MLFIYLFLYIEIDPINVCIKIISGTMLPRPRLSSATKAAAIDPYITVQTLGVPADCAEALTRTISNDGNNPMFDETFEFNIHVPELAVVRFLILDAEFIENDFIGQITIPATSLHPGYKHVPLRNIDGELIPNASLFVFISITNRHATKQQLRRDRSWSPRLVDPKPTGCGRAVDEQMRTAFGLVHELMIARRTLDSFILDICDECSLAESGNMAQCLRVITQRLAFCTTIINFKITRTELGVSGNK